MLFADFYIKSEFIVPYRRLPSGMPVSRSVTLCVPSSGDNCQWPPPTLQTQELLGLGSQGRVRGKGLPERRAAPALPILHRLSSPRQQAAPLRPASGPARSKAARLGRPHFLVGAGLAVAGSQQSPRGLRLLLRSFSWERWGRSPASARSSRPSPGGHLGPGAAGVWSRAQRRGRGARSGAPPRRVSATGGGSPLPARLGLGQSTAPALPAASQAGGVRVREGDEFLSGIQRLGFLYHLKRSWSGAEALGGKLQTPEPDCLGLGGGGGGAVIA